MIKYLMYETREYSIQTGGTSRFREMCEYLLQRNLTDIISQSGKVPENDCVTVLNPELKCGFPFLFGKTKITFANKSVIKEINNKSYTKVFVYDVPAHIGLALLGVKHICLMVRKDLLDYKRISLQASNANKVKILCWMIYLLVCEAICALNAENIIVQCDYDKSVLLNRHPLLRNTIKKKLLVQINNVNPSWIVQKSDAPLDESDAVLDHNTFNICCVSGFGDKRKGADLIVGAFMSAYGNNEAYCLHMIGDGRDLDNFRNKYKDVHNIKFWGRLQNPTKILRQCNLAVVPSRADSCPNTIMEAIYNSVPVIGSDAGGIPEMLCDQDALFETNCESLRRKLTEVVSDPEQLKALQMRQMQRKQELTFDWVQQILKICG